MEEYEIFIDNFLGAIDETKKCESTPEEWSRIKKALGSSLARLRTNLFGDSIGADYIIEDMQKMIDWCRKDE